jgi:hypothetical protein
LVPQKFFLVSLFVRTLSVRVSEEKWETHTRTHGLLEINFVQRSSPVLAEEFVYQGSFFCGSFLNWGGDEKEPVGKHGCGW